MTKNKRVISLLGLDKNVAGLFASYCHLLKPQLKENWVLNRFNDFSEIILVSPDYDEPICDKPKVKIILGESSTSDNDHNKKSVEVFHILYPLNSSKIVNVLNSVSEVKGLQKRSLFNHKSFFSLKNAFTRLISKDRNQAFPTKPKKNKSNIVADKLLNLRDPDLSKTLKVVLLGRPGSGKTTAIASASTDKVLTSEVNATDSIGLLKEQTTIGIDFGECQLDNNHKLRLYGTPGQQRYNYVQTQTVARADIYIILIDLSSVAPFSEFMYYKNIIETAGNTNALKVAAFTHYDLKQHNMPKLSKEIRRKYHGEILTVKIDTRNKEEIRYMLSKITQIKLDKNNIKYHYEANSLLIANNRDDTIH